MADTPGRLTTLSGPSASGTSKAALEALQFHCLRRVGNGDLPQLAMPGVVELAGLAEGYPSAWRHFRYRFFLADQKQLGAGQACGRR